MLAASVQNGFEAATAASKSTLLAGAEILINHPFLIATVLVSAQLTPIEL